MIPASVPTPTDRSAHLPPRRLQLLLGTAALSVTAFSLTGIAALTGLMPISHGMYAPATTDAPARSGAVLAAPASPASPQADVPPATGGTGRAASETPARPARRLVQEAPRVAAEAATATPSPTWSNASRDRAGQDRLRVSEASDAGTVESVRAVSQPAASTGLGAIGGGVLGGALGSRIGKGNGSTAMAAIGAIGGGLLGHEVEQRVRATRAYDVTLRMDDGSRRTVRYERDPGLRVGERVQTGGDAAPPARGRLPAADPSIVQVGAPA